MSGSLLSILTQNPLLFILIAGALIVSLTIHEFAHAYAANKLGDGTAKYLGRLTLNPLSHLDPLGTIMLLIAGFGWGKPVPFNPLYLKNPKRDAAIISFAGPLSNFLLAIFLALIYHAVSYLTHASSQATLSLLLLQQFIFFTVVYNIVLGVFNLIPIEPLDGFKIVNGLLPPSLSVQWVQIAPYGIFILLLLVVTGTTQKITGPAISLGLSILGMPIR